MHDLFQDVDLEVAVLAAGDGNGAVVAAGAVAAAVLVAQGLEFLPAGVPVHQLAVLVMAAGTAHPLGIKGDAGAGVRHGAAFAILHVKTPLLCSYSQRNRRWGLSGCGPNQSGPRLTLHRAAGAAHIGSVYHNPLPPATLFIPLQQATV